MATVCRAGGPADDDMRVDAGLVLVEGDVPHQRQHLDLLVEHDAGVVLGLPVEESERDVVQRADAGEMTGREALRLREVGQRGDDLIARVHDQHERALADLFYGFALHAVLSGPWVHGSPSRAPRRGARHAGRSSGRSEEHTSELQSHSFISYAVFCLKKTNTKLLRTLALGTTHIALHNT